MDPNWPRNLTRERPSGRQSELENGIRIGRTGAPSGATQQGESSQRFISAKSFYKQSGTALLPSRAPPVCSSFFGTSFGPENHSQNMVKFGTTHLRFTTIWVSIESVRAIIPLTSCSVSAYFLFDTIVTIVSYFGQATATLNQLTNRVNDHLEARGKQSTIVTARRPCGDECVLFAELSVFHCI